MKESSRPPLIQFSGIDGGGKSTQIDRLSRAFEARGHSCLVLWSRGGYTPGFSWIKSMVRRLSGHKVMPSAGRSTKRTETLRSPWMRRLWFTFATCDLIWFYGLYIRYQRWRGRAVILDRYWQDTWIDFSLNFKGYAFEKRLDWKCMKRVAPKPDVAFLLRIPVEESLRRSKLKDEPFPDEEAVLRTRLAEYDRFAEAGDYVVVDGLQSIESIERQVLAKVDESRKDS